ncbi:FitA-like ribbon-helix-helix domain-containing protein [Delftia sp. PS-11]|uniref:FitA-like ribbon-helix-helix domain-containing protein n=1 Tax=Delftia sp. PS-11 TaxID=2767222 RepID=UPI00245598ED|nr:Arc family DNA-binding protein [Delftia sp. PS-11]KAJ8742673.1 Arc family DNA-binding protein [Delftia sp. PS-11]
MAMLTVRNLPEEVHRALRVRAAQNGQSMEAEVREILVSALTPKGRVRLGSLLADMGRQAQLSETELSAFEPARDQAPARLEGFE